MPLQGWALQHTLPDQQRLIPAEMDKTHLMPLSLSAQNTPEEKVFPCLEVPFFSSSSDYGANGTG